jgi:hypothetical protein
MRNLSFFAFLFFIFTACSLEENPPFENAYEYYQTKEQCISGLNACYIPLTSIFAAQYLLITEASTDFLYVNSNAIDAQLEISPAAPGHGQVLWTNGYKGVMYCNNIIAAIRRSSLSDEIKLPLLAEGIVMRAYYYYMLTSTFGNVPFYREDVEDLEILDKIGKLGRMPAVATRDSLIEELKEYVPYMSQVRTYDIPGNRCGAAMGWMLIGKMAQWNHRWDDAFEACTKLEEIYGELDQYSLDDIAFSRKNTPESIFEVQFNYSVTGLKVTTAVAAFCMPPRNTARTDTTTIYDGVYIPELGNQSTQYSSLRPTPYYVQSCMPRISTDKRANLNLAWEYNGKSFESVTPTKPWLGTKFWSYNMYNVSDGNNQKVFRYADAILMQAENYLELNDAGNAVKYLNIVRSRAGLPDYIFKNRTLLREEIQKERGRELLGEYQRKYDLVRWGIWYDAVSTYLEDNALAKKNIVPCREYYPIPDTEVVNSHNHLDNEEYNKYGL